MKIILILIGVLLSILLSIKVYGQIAVGVGGVYSVKYKLVAPNLRMYYFPNDKVCIGPEVAWVNSKANQDEHLQSWEYNLTGHYILAMSNDLGIYPLFGVNYTTEKETLLENEIQTDAFGLNVGFGGHVGIGGILPFLEYKYVIGRLAQHAISFGILFTVFTNENKEFPTEKLINYE